MAKAIKKDLYQDIDDLFDVVELPSDKLREIMDFFETRRLKNHQSVVNDETGFIHGVVSKDWQTIQHDDILEAMQKNDKVSCRKIYRTENETTMYALYSSDKFLEIPEEDVDLELLVAIRNGHGGKAKISTELWVHNRAYNQNWRLATGKANALRMNHTNKDIRQFVDNIDEAIEVVHYRFDTHVIPRIKELVDTPIPEDIQIAKTENKDSTYAKVIPQKTQEYAETKFAVDEPVNMWELFQLLCLSVSETCDIEPQRKHILSLACEFGL